MRWRLDGRPDGRWTLAGPATLRVPDVEAGPHRLEVWFDTDRFGPDGDRNVRLTRLEG